MARSEALHRSLRTRRSLRHWSTRIGDGTLPHPDGGDFGLVRPDHPRADPARPRRAGRSVSRGAFGPALILPDIRALGEADATELPFLPPYEAGALPIAVSPIERRLTLAALVARWIETEDRAALRPSGFASPPSPAEILALADALGALIDSCRTEGVSSPRLPPPGRPTRTCPSTGNASLKFLDIALTAWPKILAASGEADAAPCVTWRSTG